MLSDETSEVLPTRRFAWRDMFASPEEDPREAGAPRLYRTDADRDGAFTGAVPDSDVVAQAWDAWLAVVMFAEQFVDAEPSLDFTGSYHTGEPISLREVLVHMIEEYARHNGHADLLRERVDGKVGQRAGGSAWAIRPPVPGPSHLPT